MKINKCDFGYMKSHRNKSIIKATFFLLLAGACFFVGFNSKGVPMYVFKVCGVLDLLPFANAFVECIMSFKGMKHKCDRELFDEINSKVSNEKPYIRYDLYMTSYSKNYPIKSITCFDGSLIGYTEFKSFDYASFDEHIKTMLANNLLKVNTIKIFDKKNKYLERIESFAKSEADISDNDYKVIRLMENLSI